MAASRSHALQIPGMAVGAPHFSHALAHNPAALLLAGAGGSTPMCPCAKCQGAAEAEAMMVPHVEGALPASHPNAQMYLCASICGPGRLPGAVTSTILPGCMGEADAAASCPMHPRATELKLYGFVAPSSTSDIPLPMLVREMGGFSSAPLRVAARHLTLQQRHCNVRAGLGIAESAWELMWGSLQCLFQRFKGDTVRSTLKAWGSLYGELTTHVVQVLMEAGLWAEAETCALRAACNAYDSEGVLDNLQRVWGDMGHGEAAEGVRVHMAEAGTAPPAPHLPPALGAHCHDQAHLAAMAGRCFEVWGITDTAIGLGAALWVRLQVCPDGTPAYDWAGKVPIPRALAQVPVVVRWWLPGVGLQVRLLSRLLALTALHALGQKEAAAGVQDTPAEWHLVKSPMVAWAAATYYWLCGTSGVPHWDAWFALDRPELAAAVGEAGAAATSWLPLDQDQPLTTSPTTVPATPLLDIPLGRGVPECIPAMLQRTPLWKFRHAGSLLLTTSAGARMFASKSTAMGAPPRILPPAALPAIEPAPPQEPVENPRTCREAHPGAALLTAKPPTGGDTSLSSGHLEVWQREHSVPGSVSPLLSRRLDPVPTHMAPEMVWKLSQTAPTFVLPPAMVFE